MRSLSGRLTFSKFSTAITLASWRDTPNLAVIVSISCVPIFILRLNAVIGFCGTKPRVVPQRARLQEGLSIDRSSPSNRSSPLVMVQVSSSTPITDFSSVVLPEPLAPVRPKHCPCSKVKEILRSRGICCFPQTDRFLISSMIGVLLLKQPAKHIERNCAQENKQAGVKQQGRFDAHQFTGRGQHAAPIDYLVS